MCERCGTQVIRKVKKQWMLKITAYAQKLLDGLDTVDFIDKVKVQQRNWIGRSAGAEVDFGPIAGEKVRFYNRARIRSSARRTWSCPLSIRFD